VDSGARGHKLNKEDLMTTPPQANPLIGDLTHREIDLMMRANRTDLHAVLNRILQLDANLKAWNATGVDRPVSLLVSDQVGYEAKPDGTPGPHLANVLSASDQWASYAAEFFSGSHDTYGQSVPLLMDEPRNVV
jgi:hypothetical protein